MLDPTLLWAAVGWVESPKPPEAIYEAVLCKLPDPPAGPLLLAACHPAVGQLQPVHLLRAVRAGLPPKLLTCSGASHARLHVFLLSIHRAMRLLLKSEPETRQGTARWVRSIGA